MEPVIITDTKEWSSIDIFLFSNGQLYSPPRKYHLRSEELQWWGATISYLGRTHYGSGHSVIELYTTDGTKINGPLELINGAAYVAVEPPDSFINTGYEEYLLRATRSWEKRLAQKSYNTETSKPDLNCINDPALQSNINKVNTPDNMDKTALNVGNTARTSPQQTRLTKPYQRFQRKSITSTKQINKKKSFDTNSALVKRICADTDKVFPCPKKIPQKKNGCLNQKLSTIVPPKLKETTNQEHSSCCKKRGSIKSEASPDTKITKNNNLCDVAPVREPQIIDLFNNEDSESMSFKNNNEHYPTFEETTQNLEQNNLTKDNAPLQDEHTSRTTTDQIQNLEKLKKSSNKLVPSYAYEQNEILPKIDNQDNEIEGNYQENDPIINPNKENKPCDTLFNGRSEKQVIDEYVAYMNKGGLLLLKLKVKLKDCKTIINKNNSKNIPTTISLSNLPKTEKTSQVDVNISFSGELLKSNDQQYTQEKSLQSLLNKLYKEENSEINNKNPRIIILQCACRNYSNNHKCCTCEQFHEYANEDRKCEDTGNNKLNETFASCVCQNVCLGTSNEENAIKNDDAIQPAKDTHEYRSSLDKANGTRVKDLAQKFEKSDKTIINDTNKNSSNFTTNENPRPSVLLTRLIGMSLSERDSENQVRGINNDLNSKSVSSKSTQTNWCNILLEAKLQEDNSYTFHLPSLYMLKQCKL